MTKFILAICIIVACTSSGYALALSAERRCNLLGEMIRSIRGLHISIVSNLEPLESALRQTQEPLFAQIAAELSAGNNPQDAWQAIHEIQSQRGGRMDCMGDGELQALNRLFEHIGRSGREAQALAMDACVEQLKSALAEARTRAGQAARLYTSIGLISGLSIVVLIV